ncbi:MAG: hypothetical protein SOH81_09715 [Acetobacter sp.]|jgi:flagellar FliJ protein
MAGSPLDALLRLRRQEVDDARQLMIKAQQDVKTASDNIKIAEQAIIAAHEAAMDLNSGDHIVEAYSLWLPTGKAVVSQARASEGKALTELASARINLTLARSALQAAEKLEEKRLHEKKEQAMRMEQNQIDESALSAWRLKAGKH